MAKNRKPTHADADLVLKLYDLRREAEMRKARNFIANFWPDSYEDLRKVVGAYGTQENVWMRQASGYWEMAASMVTRGVLHYDLFFDYNQEMFLLFAKIGPFLKQLRDEFQSPEILANVEKVVRATPKSRERLSRMEERLKKFRQMQAESAGAAR